MYDQNTSRKSKDNIDKLANRLLNLQTDFWMDRCAAIHLQEHQSSTNVSTTSWLVSLYAVHLDQPSVICISYPSNNISTQLSTSCAALSIVIIIIITSFIKLHNQSRIKQTDRRLDLRSYPKCHCHGNKGQLHNILHGSIESAIPENPLLGPNISGLSGIQADLCDSVQILGSNFGR